MKTLKTTFVTLLLLIFAQIQAQVVDTQFPELTENQKEALRNIPELELKNNQMLKNAKDLPSILDNSENKFFPPISSQNDWSCGQQSGVAYVFTYEMNCARDADGSLAENQYPTHFTWNYLNRSSFNVGASYFDSWKIIKEFGHPNSATFDPGDNNTMWMDGYGNYLSAMENRIESVHSIKVDTEEGLIKLKNWLLDHAGESEYGGVANYYGASDYNNFLPGDTPEAGNQVVVRMHEQATHALTIVGYNDEIRYDFNSDGLYTNDVDINGDGTVDMRDWEIGGFIVANSFSEQWGNDGFVYVMYKLAAEKPDVGGFWNNTVNLIKVKKDYLPKLSLKASINYTSRHRIKVYAGIAKDTNATEPEIIREFPILNYQGGARYMQGGNTEENKIIEVGLDISQFYYQANINDFTKFFLIVNENDFSEYAEGEIISFSVIDHTTNNETLAYLENPVNLTHGDNVVTLNKQLNNNEELEITTTGLPITRPGESFEKYLQVTGGEPPYEWSIIQDEYTVEIVKDKFDRSIPNSLDFSSGMNGIIEIDLDFNFPFYDNTYDKIKISGNGSILFDDDLLVYPYLFFREFALSERKGISVFGANDQTYGYYNFLGYQTYNGDAIQISWSMGHYYLSAVTFDYRAKLYKDGTIEFNFNDFDALGLTYISGISNGNEVEYTVSPYSNRQIISDSTVIRFTPPGVYFPELSIDNDGKLKGIAPSESRESKIKIMVKDFNGAFCIKEFAYNTWPNPVNEIKENETSIYPNPFNDELTIVLNDQNSDNIQVFITDILGKELYRHKFELNSSNNEIRIESIANLKPGSYFIFIGNSDKFEVYHVIKR